MGAAIKGFEMTIRGDDLGQTLDEPFPLQRRFRRRFLPALAGFVGILLVLIGLTARQVIETIYLELAQKRAQTIASSVQDVAPEAWRQVMEGVVISELSEQGPARMLVDALAAEQRHLNLDELKVYDLQHKVLYATDQSEIGSSETAQVLSDVIDNGVPSVATKALPDGTKQYEFYVPVFDGTGTMRVVFELYEPVGYLDAILTRAALPLVTIPGGLLIIFAFALDRLVRRAQFDIDARTTLIIDMRKRLESFVSATAVGAARRAGEDGSIESLAVETTLFFSDIRDFTGYAEQHGPAEVVAFLNRLMTLQVDVIGRHNGDVDKMIGDAVLARFDKNEDAIAAAVEILDAVKEAAFPRAIGIGIYRGTVISGAIGPADRRDFTVIGDAVNVASRLCSAAAAGEVVVDAEMADDSFGGTEWISVKGRTQPLAVRRKTLGA
jgi:adenylate cyclase